MDRIEAYEEFIEEESTASFSKLTLPALARFQVKKTSNVDHARNTALADEIKKTWGLPIPRVMKFIERYGYKWVRECYHYCIKAECQNPPALFQWKLKQAKPDMQEV